MKVIAFNCSPKMDKGNTALILNPFVEGMKEAGAEVELFHLRKLKINPCRGCGICAFQTPGTCFRKDDMQMLYPKLREADIWAFGCPVYWSGIPGPMKNLIDRIMPLVLPFMEMRDGRSRNLLREGTRRGRIVVVSTGGTWEMDSFDLVLATMREVASFVDRACGRALLRPHADAMMPLMEMGTPLDDIFQAAKQAGQEMVQDGEMSAETVAAVRRELMPPEEYLEFCNQGTQEALDELRKKE